MIKIAVVELKLTHFMNIPLVIRKSTSHVLEDSTLNTKYKNKSDWDKENESMPFNKNLNTDINNRRILPRALNLNYPQYFLFKKFHRHAVMKLIWIGPS